MRKPTNILYDIHEIADDIHRAINRPRSKERFITTREKQIEFMWHLYGQGFTAKEIGKVYDITEANVWATLDRKYKGVPIRGKKTNFL